TLFQTVCSSDRLSLLEFVPGTPVVAVDTPDDERNIGDQEVREATDFIRKLNQFREAADLAIAEDGCFSLAQHLETVNRRVTRLTSASAEWSSPDLMQFLCDRLVPQWTSVRDDMTIQATEAGLSVEAEIPIFERILSPVDFGFHNAIRTPAGPLTFVDFESSGWDDPARLICDFFTHPVGAAPIRHLDEVVRAAGGVLNLDRSHLEGLHTRVELLLPLYRVKWCCRILGELSVAARARRAVTGASDDEARIHALLDRAVEMLERANA
ncbi:MAG: hypothetical protein KDC38_08060, partial [Planctomycetes bacterium]|nr:hypothetical protein [Planctomycetota bacterium]